MTGISFLTNNKGTKTALVLDFKAHKELVQDILDGIEAESRKNEPKKPYSEIRKELIAQNKI
jgi:hypothetical protein